MDPEKRRTIVNEIEHWRRSKLLPEQYCDFLMNLYLEDPADRPKKVLGLSASSIRDSNWKVWLGIGASAVLFFLSVFHFSSFQFPLQIAIGVLLLLCLYTTASVQRKKRPAFSYALFGISSAFLLFFGVFMMWLHGNYSENSLAMFIVLCSIVWLVTGLAAGISVLHLCGWVGLMFGYNWFLNDQGAVPNVLLLEVAWLPLSIIFCWVGWLLHQKFSRASGVLFLISVLAWFMPEIYGMLYEAEMLDAYIQLLWVGKIVIAGIVLFTLRRKWTEWVTF